MKTVTCLSIGLLLTALSGAHADERAKTEYQTIPLQKLSKTGGEFNWAEEAFLAAINKQGEEGWETLLNSDVSFLFRKLKPGPKWEYKSVKIKNSPFAITGSKDVDAYEIILDRMGADGFVPCAVNTFAEYTLFKRVKDAKPGKPEFKVILLGDVIKTKVAPAERWKEQEFLDVMNKQGSEGWDWCLGNCNAILFQKSPVKWEFKVVKVTKNPLARNLEQFDKDDEAAAFKLILEGLEAKGWTPCGVGLSNQEILCKREAKPDVKEKK
jgi:hypothetical protein